MAEKLDPRQVATFEELLRAMMFETEATRRILSPEIDPFFTKETDMKYNLSIVFVVSSVALLGVVGNVLAVSKTDPYRTCESKHGQFIDKNNDGEVNRYDWRSMNNEEKRLQATWNLETVCKQATLESVQQIIKSLDAISEIR